MSRVKEIWVVLLTVLKAQQKFLKYLTLSSLAGTLLVSGILVLTSVQREKTLAREKQQHRLYQLGETDITALTTAEDLAFPAAPLPQVEDYYLWRQDGSWSRDEIARYWNDADQLSLRDLRQKNRQQLLAILEQAH